MKQTFSFDRYGNRRFDQANTSFPSSFSNTAVSNPAINTSDNRFTSGQGYTYDAAGNVLTDAEGRSFTYDAENKQKEVKNSSNQTIGLYYFDGDGRRVKKVTGSETVIFVFDAAGKLVAEYSTSPSETPQVQYLTNDNLGTPRINTNENGAVVSRTDYMPYGEEIIGLGGRSTTDKYVADDVRQGFTGYLNDEETGLDYAQARMYKKELGRFLGVDPVFEIQSPSLEPQLHNLYAYVGNNPMNASDPTGAFPVRLGRSISDINARKRDIDKLKLRRDALKANKGGLSNSEFKAQMKEIDNAIKGTNVLLGVLQFERQGNEVVSKMLGHLKDLGEDNGLILSDFTLSTDPQSDFSDSNFDDNNENAFVRRNKDGTLVSQQIYINAKGPMFQGAIGNSLEGTSEDWILYGASTLRHEQSHRDERNPELFRSEGAAYKTQEGILKRLGSKFKSQSFFDKQIRNVRRRANWR
ncbi:MAG: RHS repeat-associated core domain-containing protein [Acidobacteria bacterium]|nr:RHS repeat-associated core domain-containing protein [Acidobacteriota bacterium]